MKLLFLLIFINIFYKNVQLSIFVKIEWKENGENNEEYYKELENKGTERFKLELTGVGSLVKYSGKTNEYDTYYFVDHDGNKEKINQFNLQVLIKEKKVIIGNINNIENNAIIYIIPRLNKTKYIKITENNEKLINLLNNPEQINQLNEQEKILYKQYFDEDKAILIDGDWETIKEIVPQNQKRKDKAHDQGTSEIIRSTKRVGKSVQTSQRKSKPTSSYQTSSYQLDERCTRLTNLITIYTYLYEQHQTHIQNIKNTTQGIQQQNLLETENANYLRGLNLRLNEMENILPGIRNSPLYNNLMTEFIQQQVNQQNIPQHQPTRTVPRHQRQSHPRRQGGQRQLTRFGREAFQEEALPHEENRNDPSSSRPDKGKNVVETHSEHSSDSEHTTQQLRDIYRQQQLGEGSSLPGHLQGGFMGTTPYSTDSLTDEQTIELLAADRFNLSQGGQGILQGVVQQTHEGGTSSTHQHGSLNLSTDLDYLESIMPGIRDSPIFQECMNQFNQQNDYLFAQAQQYLSMRMTSQQQNVPQQFHVQQPQHFFPPQPPQQPTFFPPQQPQQPNFFPPQPPQQPTFFPSQQPQQPNFFPPQPPQQIQQNPHFSEYYHQPPKEGPSSNDPNQDNSGGQ